MGVGGGFWELVRPLRQSSEDLSTLQGKRLAIDLSFWIVQQEAVLKDKVRKPHLRLLFFRVVTLVAKVGALPVFVVDGDAPLLKLPARIERFSRISGIPADQLHGEGNARNQAFLDSVEECVELLELLNVPVLRATSESEALCAELERMGVVDACVTPDSDAFLHGASCVIQNLQADVKRPLVESYFFSDILSKLQLDREHLIALALLVGCDYNTRGVPGIGYSHAVRLVQYFSKTEILDNLRKWGRREYPSQETIRRLTDPDTEIEKSEDHFNLGETRRRDSHCSMCGHPGNKRLHAKLGCKGCESLDTGGCFQKAKDFKCACESCKQGRRKKKQEKDVSWWSKISERISAVEGFPSTEIIELFLNTANTSYLKGGQSLDLQWTAPQMEPLEQFLALHLHWDASYTRMKALPLLSHYCLKSIAEGSSKTRLHDRYTPDSIQKIRLSMGKPFYVVKWTTVLALDDDFITTDEQIYLVQKACPSLVSKFQDRQKSKKMTRRGKKGPDPNQKSILSYFIVKPKHADCEAADSEPQSSTTALCENYSSPSPSKRIIDVDLDEDTESAVKRRLFDG